MRRSGKTFRALLIALGKASSGEDIVFLTQAPEYACNMARSITFCITCVIQPRDKEIRFTGPDCAGPRGSITFVDVRDAKFIRNGVPKHRIVEDP